MEIDLTASAQDMEWIATIAKQHAEVAEVSAPMATDATRVLNLGLPHFDLAQAQAGFVFLTVVFKTGSAGVSFYKALREALQMRGGVIAVTDSETGRQREN